MSHPTRPQEQPMSAADLPCAVVQKGKRKYLTKLSFGQVSAHRESISRHDNRRVRKISIGATVLLALILIISLYGKDSGSNFLQFMILAVAFFIVMAAFSIRTKMAESVFAKFERDNFLQETTSASPDAVHEIERVEELAQEIQETLEAMTTAGIPIPSWVQNVRIDILHVVDRLCEEWFHESAQIAPQFERLEESATQLKAEAGRPTQPRRA